MLVVMRRPALRIAPLLVFACSVATGCTDTTDPDADTDASTSSSSSSGTSAGSTSTDPTDPSTTGSDGSSSTGAAESTDTSTTGTAECEAGFYGPDCAGECACANGVCDEGRDGSGACACDDGWSGDACDACATGFFGADCGACTCVNGFCDDGLEGSGACECDEGWTGSDCAHDCGDGMLNDDGTCSVLLEAVEDAYICSDDLADTNMGTDARTTRAVGQQNDFTGNQIGRALFKFDLSPLPADSTVEASVVRLRQWDNFAGFPMDTRLSEAPTDWVETTVTWNDQPTAGASLGAQEIGCCGEDYDWDVGASVATAFDDGGTEVAFQLASDDEGTVGGLRWWMREGDGMDGGRAPRLLVRYAVP